MECVFLTCFLAHFSFLATVMHYSRIRMHRAETLEEADFLLTVTGGTVLLCDVVFLDGSWREALRMASDCHGHVASLLLAERVEEPFLGDAPALGACGVVWKPVQIDELIRLIRILDEAARSRVALQGSLA